MKKQDETGCDRGMKKCGKRRCQLCKYVDEENTFSSVNHTYNINSSFDCDSEAVFYLIICKKFNKICVGSTITSFRKRFSNHRCSWLGTRRDKGI